MKKSFAVLLTITLVFLLSTACTSSMAENSAARTEYDRLAFDKNDRWWSSYIKQNVQSNEMTQWGTDPHHLLTPAAMPEDADGPVILVSGDYFVTREAFWEAFSYAFGKPEHPFYFVSSPDRFRATVAEKAAWADNMRIQILSGGGPDAYITMTVQPFAADPNTWSMTTNEVYVFQNVEKSMRSGLFLPLDGWIESSELLHMEDFPEIIMEKGRAENGQMVLPLTYTYAAIPYNRASIGDALEPDRYNTWADFVGTDDLRVQGNLNGTAHALLASLPPLSGDTEEILLTADALAARITEIRELPEYETEMGDVVVVDSARWQYALELLPAYDPETYDPCFLPIKNEAGGINAYITSFAAINPNTQYAEQCFNLIELLLSREVQSSAGLETENGETVGAGAATFGTERCLGPYADVPVSVHNVQIEVYGREFRFVDSISSVEFFSQLDFAVQSAYIQSFSAETPEQLQKIAEQAISEMKMILAE